MPMNAIGGQSPLTTEEEYFRRRDSELIEQMRTRAAAQQRLERLSQLLQVKDEDILNAVAGLGFNETTAVLLWIVPMADVAWSDGVVTQAQRDIIVATAREEGVAPGTPADQLLTAWLEQPPPIDLFMATLKVLRDLFQLLPPCQRTEQTNQLLRRCTDVAGASGGFFGLTDRVSAIERARLSEIEAAISALTRKRSSP
jgi:hypothetical protein